MKSIKWGWVLIVLVLFLAGFWLGGFRSGSTSPGALGFVDMDLLFKESSRAKALQEELDKAQAGAKKMMAQEEAKLEAARRRAASPEQLRKMVDQAQQAMAGKQKELVTLNDSLTKKLEQEIKKVCAQIAKQHRLTAVVHERLLLWGGEDVTRDVLRALNQGKNEGKS